MITEYIGLPGAGKTHLSKKSSRESGKPFVKISGRAERYRYATLFAFRYPSIFVFFLWQTIKENYRYPMLLWHKIHLLYLETLATEEKAAESKADVIDQGLCFYLLPIYEREITLGELQKYEHYLLKDRRIVIVRAEHSIREKRMRDRERFPRSIFGKEYQEGWLSVLERNSVVVETFLRRHYEFIIIENN